jgi:hypothetical protein
MASWFSREAASQGESAKALKRPHSKNWRAASGAPAFAKRLECGRFSAAFLPKREFTGRRECKCLRCERQGLSTLLRLRTAAPPQMLAACKHHYALCTTARKTYTRHRMKRACSFGLVLALAITLLTGCSWSVGSSPKTSNVMPTTGQQLMDLQKARNAGAINDAEYQVQRAKLLGNQ